MLNGVTHWAAVPWFWHLQWIGTVWALATSWVLWYAILIDLILKTLHCTSYKYCVIDMKTNYLMLYYCVSRLDEWEANNGTVTKHIFANDNRRKGLNIFILIEKQWFRRVFITGYILFSLSLLKMFFGIVNQNLVWS